ncbi:M24 family metallopeptidase [Paludifilum halophilum]|uniref:Peptidase M24 family protein n=1 Tax=Paludifilum halophilum TaxID=1642702 RepID=A0A235BBZ7_9BACL|nr:Xaa-Pro peptidase family protein [Paludifilum halophilum]OYD09814.1 peptidase M24 family protein [Paludifilum halophilum]
MNTRLNSAAEQLKHRFIDFALLNSKSNVFYLSGFDCEPHERLLALFLFPDAEPFLVCPELDRERARVSGWDRDIVAYGDADDPWKKIRAALKERGIKNPERIAVEKEQLSYARAEALKKIFPSTRLVSAEENVQPIRMVKNADEVQTLTEAARLADFGVEAGLRALKTGCTEMEVIARIEYELKQKGVREMSFSTMVLFGEKSGQPHGVPGERKLKEGDFVLFDLGVIYNGYCSDITRTFVYRSVTEEQIRIYETVLQSQTAVLERCHPGTPISELDRTARGIIDGAGYGEYFPHRIGHGLGIEAHEFPSLHEKNEDLLREGMVFTVEPGIYIPELGGVRIEDDLVITADGHRTLTRFPKELQVVS